MFCQGTRSLYPVLYLNATSMLQRDAARSIDPENGRVPRHASHPGDLSSLYAAFKSCA